MTAVMPAGHPYPLLARLTVEKYLAGDGPPDSLPAEVSPDMAIWSIRRACFVTIKTSEGDLRGCIGTIVPVQPDLGREIMVNAVSAATRDPRFSPMSGLELPRAGFSVDVLGQPELVRDLGELDPSVWGVIVTRDGRRGLLLPDLEGVDTVEAQLSIAARKAGLRGYDGAEIQRFSVTRYPER